MEWHCEYEFGRPSKKIAAVNRLLVRRSENSVKLESKHDGCDDGDDEETDKDGDDDDEEDDGDHEKDNDDD